MKWTQISVSCLIIGLLSGFINVTASMSADTQQKGTSLDGDVLTRLHYGHPRLLTTSYNDFTRNANNPLFPDFKKRLLLIADAIVLSGPEKSIAKEYANSPSSALNAMRHCVGNLINLSVAYRLTKDKKYSNEAIREMLEAANLPDWNQDSYLSTAELTAGMALGYDWLYDVIPPSSRKIIKSALVNKSLDYKMKMGSNPLQANPPSWYQNTTTIEDSPVHRTNNWNQVCNSGLLLGALAIADEEPVLARKIIKGVLAPNSLPLGMKAYAAEGSYPEGPGYWTYGTDYNVLGIAALQSALGTDYGLSNQPGFNKTALFNLYVNFPAPGHNRVFSYADSDESQFPDDPAETWLIKRFNLPGILASRKPGSLLNSSPNNYFYGLHALWMDDTSQAINTRTEPLDYHFSGIADVATFRSAWNDPNAIYLGLKAGTNGTAHSHMDLGSFVLDADGVRWAHDMGGEDYSIPGYWDDTIRWTYFKANNNSHNVFMPNAVIQNKRGVAPIRLFKQLPSLTFAIANLTNAYPGHAERIERGAFMIDRKKVVIQDEIESPVNRETWQWSMFTKAQITLNGSQAQLTQNGKSLYIKIQKPRNAVFQVLPATPPTKAERQNVDFKRLAIRIPAQVGQTTRLSVLFIPGSLYKNNVELLTPTVRSLSYWDK